MAAVETRPDLGADASQVRRGGGAAGLEVSVVIPAYNESARLPTYLGEVRSYLTSVFGARYEVIIVDDGSRDGTAHLLEAWGADWPQLRALRHPTNRGKGAAVRTGVLAARGEVILFADADGSTPIGEEVKLRTELAAGADLAVGSRLLPSAGTVVSRPLHRGLAGRLFALLAWAVLRLPVRDTQCGFKMFRREAGRRLFLACDEPGYLFDLHILALARRYRLRTAEVAVHWEDRPGSKVDLLRDPWRMLLGLVTLRARIRSADPGEALGPGRLTVDRSKSP